MKYYKTTHVNGGSWYDPDFIYQEGHIRRPKRGTIADSYETCTKRVLHACRTPEEAASASWNVSWPFRLWSFEGTPVVEDKDKAGFRQVGPMVVEDVSLCFGPSGTRVSALLNLLATVNSRRFTDLVAAWTSAHGQAPGFIWGSTESTTQYRSFRNALGAVQVAKNVAGRRLPCLTARSAAGSIGRPATAGSAVRCAAQALVVFDLVGQHGLERHHIDTLLAPVIEVFGEDWIDQ